MKGEKVQVPWSDIDTLLLDMDGTLLDLAFDNFFWLELVPEVYARSRRLSAEAARDDLFARYRAVAGTLPWYCLDHWSAELDLDIVELKKRHRHRIRYLPGAREFLSRARARGKHLVLVTNAHQVTIEIKSSQTGIGDLMDVIVTSHDYGVEKEQPGFWTAFEAEHRIDPGRALLLEDNLTVLKTAANCGIAHTIAIRRPDTTRESREIEGFRAVDGVIDLGA
jgi:HAD superfamily hydrolase (TIGR01509 family)